MRNGVAPDVNTADGAASALPATGKANIIAAGCAFSLQHVSLPDIPVRSLKRHCCDQRLYSIPPSSAGPPAQPPLPKAIPGKGRRLPWGEPTSIEWYPVLASPGRPRAAPLKHLLQTEDDGRYLLHSAGGPEPEPEPAKPQAHGGKPQHAALALFGRLTDAEKYNYQKEN